MRTWGENRVKRNPRSRTTLQTDEHRDRAGSGMCHLCPIIHLQYEDALLPRRSRTRDEKLGSLSARVPLIQGRAARLVPSRPRRPSEAEERRVKGETGSRAAPQTEPGWQVPSVRSNAESTAVKPAPGASGSSAASCPECCSGSSSGALLASPLSSAGLCKEKMKTRFPASSNTSTWPCLI